jgi:hypothetical protein
MLKNGDKAKVTGKPTLPPRPMFGKAGDAAAPDAKGKASMRAKAKAIAADAIAKGEKKAKPAKPAKAKVDPKPKPIKAAKATKPAKDKTAPKARAAKTDGAPTKRSLAINLLSRKEGTTLREILDATGWPAVSVPEIAKAGKLNLRKEKPEGEKVTRYWGTPIVAA